MTQNTIRRRRLLASAAAGLALPAIARAQSSKLLKFIPQADLSTLDPHWNTAYVTRNHAYMVFDTLYGRTAPTRRRPQMLAGATHRERRQALDADACATA